MGFYLCRHCTHMVSHHVYHDCQESKAYWAAESAKLWSKLSLDLQFDVAAAKKDETAHQRRAPKGTWR
jgi:hypothetical protein